MDNVCNRCLFSIPSKVEMAEEPEYLRGRTNFGRIKFGSSPFASKMSVNTNQLH